MEGTGVASGVAISGRDAIVELPFGRTPYRLDLTGRDAEVIAAPEVVAAEKSVAGMIADALDAPIGSAALDAGVAVNARVTIVISDATRDEPRAAFIAGVRARLGDGVRWTIAIATGTHGPAALDTLGVPDDLLHDATIVNHDGHREDDLVSIGVTSRGTPVRLHRCAVEADLVVATGCIRPHYFAGFGAGVKAIFPGLGQAAAIRTNHRWKVDPASRAGIVEGNPCREDLEEAVAMLPARAFLLDGVCAPDGAIRAVVAGDLVAAFRVGVAQARPWFTVEARPANVVIASDVAPVTSSLYQAAKIAAAVAPLVATGGSLVVVAECSEGIGPLDVVNEAIVRIGVLPRLAPGVRLHLVSGLSPASVSYTLFGFATSAERFLGAHRVLVVPRASQLLCEAVA